MTWIQTTHGGRFDLLNPTHHMVDIDDIVTASARLYRFTGHGHATPLDLNQHHLLVASIAATIGADVDAALVHDAHEVYVGDASRPLKEAMRVCAVAKRSPYDIIERRAQRVVCRSFGIDPARMDAVKEADNLALGWEANRLFGATWGLPVPEWEPLIYHQREAGQEMRLHLNRLRAGALKEEATR